MIHISAKTEWLVACETFVRIRWQLHELSAKLLQRL